MPEFKVGDRVRVTSLGNAEAAGKIIAQERVPDLLHRVEFTHATAWARELFGDGWWFADTALEHID
ncbi:hypothetical protein [Gordonia westfalica]|uniref:Uncharacterized protein n=1 Tax=Gordonia westfalica TaxID=158898 RepID=A0A1H2DN02_9ACTN|nr:hypothetical protein [Gordonia westfalica]SDT84303.1 hypothetical protein SAMN04488548_1088 [Gordonia westfalica]SDT84382.1 hypothetical protein SAMN04488548_10833 [Gordonia westfalica]SDT84400.1 hypothetical protein SAMN04488548_10839 [Gordonia westfalica]SDT87131.1 hypothetical protein SAMN04488548_12424 [Gordonia westfalica]SDT87717.1 hypothetical protein SAMN04488548_12521 [Gordonia westfalica]